MDREKQLVWNMPVMHDGVGCTLAELVIDRFKLQVQIDASAWISSDSIVLMHSYTLVYATEHATQHTPAGSSLQTAINRPHPTVRIVNNNIIEWGEHSILSLSGIQPLFQLKVFYCQSSTRWVVATNISGIYYQTKEASMASRLKLGE